MKTYTVREISEMLGKNPETVRRWIREGKLKAGQDSRKGGNYVTEEDLKKFLKNTPKYAALLGGAALSVPGLGVGIPVALGGVVVGLLGLLENNTKDKRAQFDLEAIVRAIEDSIKLSKQSIRKKREVIAQLEKEIRSEEQQIENYLLTLDQIKKQQVKDKKEE